MEQGKRAVFMVLVTGRKLKDAMIDLLHEANVNLIDVIYGKGAVKASFLMNMLGLIPEENKVIITIVTTVAKSDTVLTKLVEKYDFNKPNTGMAFTIPIEAVSY